MQVSRLAAQNVKPHSRSRGERQGRAHQADNSPPHNLPFPRVSHLWANNHNNHTASKLQDSLVNSNPVNSSLANNNLANKVRIHSATNQPQPVRIRTRHLRDRIRKWVAVAIANRTAEARF